MQRNKRTYGNLTIYDNGIDGLSYRIEYIHPLYKEPRSEYGGITSDDMLDYTFEENIPSEYEYLTEEEKEFFEKEYFRIKRNAKHKEYYDPYDNTWKNYED